MEIPRLPPRERTSMPVSELKTLFGIKKVESYWIIHNKPIETVTVAGKLRIVISSFEEWYASQFHYKKINGPPPGAYWRSFTLSVGEVAEILGISESSTYELLKRAPIETVKVDNRTRIYKESFHRWYLEQTRYPIRDDYIGGVKIGVNRQKEE